MISQKLQEAINAQIVAEMWSANLYLSMSYFFAAKGYEGFASWMKAQAHEESDHADVLAQYVMKRGGQAKVGAVDAVPQEWASPLDVFEHVYKHECHVSELIDKLVDVASAEKDKASQDFLWGFVREQVEEEATVQGILDKIKLGGDVALYHWIFNLAQENKRKRNECLFCLLQIKMQVFIGNRKWVCPNSVFGNMNL